jgi:hypothetical protein
MKTILYKALKELYPNATQFLRVKIMDNLIYYFAIIDNEPVDITDICKDICKTIAFNRLCEELDKTV